MRYDPARPDDRTSAREGDEQGGNAMHAVILAGGLGTRLAPYTTVLPKPLVPICGVPILELILLQLREHGFQDVTLCTRHMARLLLAYFGDGSRYGLRLQHSLETAPLGTAGPLALLPPFQEPALVMNSDVVSTLDFSDLYRFHRAHRGALTVSLFTKPMRIDLGVIQVDDGTHAILDYVEKPEFRFRVSMGVYVVDPSVRALISPGERVDFPEIVRRLLERNERVVGYPFDGFWVDVGQAADHERASAQLEQHCARFLRQARMLAAQDPPHPPQPSAGLDSEPVSSPV